MSAIFRDDKIGSTWKEYLTLPSVILFIAFATASGDIFFVLKVGGLNVRLGQLLFAFLILISLPTIIRADKIIWPTGFSYFLIVLAIATAFVPNSPFLTRNIGYLFWSFLSAASVFILTQLYGRVRYSFFVIFKAYIYSFIFPALFGLFQFAAGMWGKEVLVTQWLVPGRVVRINGFSYEPSYFSLYESLGWVTSLVLLFEGGAGLFNRKFLSLTFMLITISLLLSTSKTAILMIFGVAFFWAFFVLTKFLVGRRVKVLGLLAAASIPAFTLGLISWVVTAYPLVIQLLVRGLGILGTASHSINDRAAEFLDTVRVFEESPIIGVSFGGVGPAIYMLYHREFSVEDFNLAKTEGLNVFAEILAATGVIGFIFFIIYILNISFIIFRKRCYSKHDFTILKALAVSLLVELALLTSAQNIFRPYVWNHIAILSAGLAVLPRLNKHESS